jgi:hypothetical protein
MTEKEFEPYMLGFALGFVAAVVLALFLYARSSDTCSRLDKACRIQTCARLVIEGGVTRCEEWKP